MTTNKITESEIEKFAIELLEKQGCQYIYAPSIAPDSDTPERQSFEDVLLMERLQSSVGRINPFLPSDIREDAIKQIQRLNSPELIANNEVFHRMLTEGITVTYQRDGQSRGDLVWFMAWKTADGKVEASPLIGQLESLIKGMLDKKILLGRDMWLTGFDVPSMHTLYIDKPMKGHNLMQAIARVNRVYRIKPADVLLIIWGLHQI